MPPTNVTASELMVDAVTSEHLLMPSLADATLLNLRFENGSCARRNVQFENRDFNHYIRDGQVDVFFSQVKSCMKTVKSKVKSKVKSSQVESSRVASKKSQIKVKIQVKSTHLCLD